MDPLGVTASIIVVLQLTESVVGYLSTVRNASADQKNIVIEASSLYGLLTTLRNRFEASHSDDPWFHQVRRLSDKNGPLDQFKSILESIALTVELTAGAAKALKILTWKFDKCKVEEALKRIERLKSLIVSGLPGWGSTGNIKSTATSAHRVRGAWMMAARRSDPRVKTSTQRLKEEHIPLFQPLRKRGRLGVLGRAWSLTEKLFIY